MKMVATPAWPRAVEFGEYLAKAAEQLLDAQNAMENAPFDEDVEVRRTEAWRALQSAIYEFRKRAAKASAEVAQIEREECLRGWEEAISFALTKVSHPIMEEVERILDAELARRRAEVGK